MATLDDVKKAVNHFEDMRSRYFDPVRNPGVTWQQVDNARRDAATLLINDAALRQQAEQAFPTEE